VKGEEGGELGRNGWVRKGERTLLRARTFRTLETKLFGKSSLPRRKIGDELSRILLGKKHNTGCG
jgi:hypothetical protein